MQRVKDFMLRVVAEAAKRFVNYPHRHAVVMRCQLFDIFQHKRCRSFGVQNSGNIEK